MDVHIGTVDTQVTATDPKFLNDPKFLAKIVQMVKEELAREDLEQSRREHDRNPQSYSGRRLTNERK